MRIGDIVENLITAQSISASQQEGPTGGKPLLHCTQERVRGSQRESLTVGQDKLCSKNEWDLGFGRQRGAPQTVLQTKERGLRVITETRWAGLHSLQNALSCLVFQTFLASKH